MKLSSALFFLLGTTFPLSADQGLKEDDELTVILELIETTKQNLQLQQKLLKLIIDFKKTREAFIAQPTSPQLATSLVKTAEKVLLEIENNHLTQLFSSDFLTEIRFFSQVAQKQRESKIPS